MDTDMNYGHQRDIPGYFQAVDEISRRLPQMTDLLAMDDLLIITADHGCDPSFRGTDHTREYVPLLLYRKGAKPESIGSLGIRGSLIWRVLRAQLRH